MDVSSAHRRPLPPVEIAITSQPRSRAGIWFFAFFFLSGFCSILYELIWLRLAMAQFGVTTAMVSIVLSTFMAGLGIGSWAAGHGIRKYAQTLKSPLRLYALTELLIGCSAILVPLELLAGRRALEHLSASLALSSSGYYFAAGLWLACTLIPWCACMGATIPVGMFAIRRDPRLESGRSFSFLYLANVLGALVGAVVPLLLIEILGFRGTLRCGMVLNLLVCFTALILGRKPAPQPSHDDQPAAQASAASTSLSQISPSVTLWLLFATGLTSMGMEIVWTRQFAIFIGTFVYSFATILGVYLAATFLGSMVYRWWSRRHSGDNAVIWLGLWITSLLTLLAADPRIKFLPWWSRVPLGIALFSGLLGFVTPQLVDRYSQGDPDRAGLGYAVNVLGCILGPLVAGFFLLPHLEERYALVLLAAPWLLVGLAFTRSRARSGNRFPVWQAVASTAIVLGSASLILLTQNYIQRVPGAQVRRDSTATVVAAGSGLAKGLYVNGISMTFLTPFTKSMSALPLTSLNHRPQNALVICFGMGTTHRSMLSWGIDSTAVELVPSVPDLFWYYHADAPQLLKSPHSHVIIDDGRRFLERSSGQYDVIVIDPPPPVGAAGSSLLYTREFYRAAKMRLRPGGILQQWFPGGDFTTTAAVARALKDSFPYVRAFVAFDNMGIHYLASNQPFPVRSAAEMAALMPAAAAADLVEWGPFPSAQQQLAALLRREVSVDRVIALDPHTPAMQDDRPINEYAMLRSLGARLQWKWLETLPERPIFTHELSAK
jgi:predicted membrane-bound spermidine synthase